MRNYYNKYGLRKITLNVQKMFVLRLKAWQCFSVLAQHLVKPLVVSLQLASSVNCVIVSDTDVSIPARMKTELSTKSTRTSCTE